MRWDNELPVICRKFFYLPLEHSENLADQEHSVVLFAGLRQSLAVRAKNWILPMIMPSSTVTSLHNLAVSRTETRFWAENPRRQRRLIWRQPKNALGREVSNGNYQ